MRPTIKFMPWQYPTSGFLLAKACKTFLICLVVSGL